MTRDLKDNLGSVVLLVPQDLAHTTTKTKVLDVQGFQSAAMLLNVGAITGGDGSNYCTPKLQESDTTNDADFTDVAASDLLGTFATAAASTPQFIGYRGSKRYVRMVLTFTGTGVTAFLASVSAMLGHADYAPVTAPAPIAAT